MDATSANHQGLMDTAAKPKASASSVSLMICSRVASGLNRVWSIARATCCQLRTCAASSEMACDIYADCNLFWGIVDKYADVRKIAIPFRVVQAIADHELIGNLEA